VKLRHYTVSSLLEAGADISYVRYTPTFCIVPDRNQPKSIKDKNGETAIDLVPSNDEKLQQIFRQYQKKQSYSRDDIASGKLSWHLDARVILIHILQMATRKMMAKRLRLRIMSSLEYHVILSMYSLLSGYLFLFTSANTKAYPKVHDPYYACEQFKSRRQIGIPLSSGCA
jgi:hypothetical protein